MRLLLARAALLAPAFVLSAYIPGNAVVDAVVEPPPPPLPATPATLSYLDIQQNHAAFSVPCQADDEAFNFSFEILEPLPNVACGSSNILVNGQALEATWSESQWFESRNGRSNITALSSLNELNRTLELSFKTVCLAGTLTGSSNSPFPATEGDAVGITFVRIDTIDGRPSLSQAGFTVSFDQPKQQIVGVVDSLSNLPINAPVVPSTTSSEPETSHQVPHSSINDETAKLQYLQNELDALTLTVNRQKELVQQLNRPERTQTAPSIKECQDVKCVARHIFQKAKHCVHFVVIHLAPKRPQPPSEPIIDPDCYWTHSRQARMHAAMKGQKLCSEQDQSSQSGKVRPSESKHDSKARPESASTSSFSTTYSTSRSTDTIHKILVPVSVVASFLCLSCFAVHLHRNCCNPRAKAERAARREERETQRQYARLARQHKWRTWWSKRLCLNTKPSSSDYEEKRSLIQAQERVLEQAMQAEIGRVQHETVPFDRDPLQGPYLTESLPPYRSRAGSGRPPSYTSQPEPSRSATVPAGAGVSEVNPAFGDVYPASDITPDSSIANLSRRNSSDTLHTERGII